MLGKRMRSATVLAACALALLPASAASAAPAVTNTNDAGPGSLRQAIAEAAPGETVTVPAGTYTLTSEPLLVEKRLTIAGQGAGTTVIRSGPAIRVFEIFGAGNNVTISGTTIRDGLVAFTGGVALGGGVFAVEANLTLRGVVVTNNRAITDGVSGESGGVALGGGVFSAEGVLTITDSVFSDNVASAKGGSGKSGGVTLGGALYRSGAFTIENSTFSGNLTNSRGGQGPANPEQNGGVSLGGGIFAPVEEVAPSTMAASTIDRNVAQASGGPGATGGVVLGGGIFTEADKSSLQLNRLTVAANSAHTSEGGVGLGGGLFVEAEGSGAVALTAATISGNTLEAPAPPSQGGNLFATPGVKIANTIVSAGVGPAGSENCGSIEKGESLGFNIDSADQCGFKAAGDLVNTNPLLGPLQSNGGPTATMALPANSPAVDKGAAFGLGSDQRGVLRPIDFPAIANSAAPGADGSDIGAFELQPASAVTLGKLKRNKKKGTATLSAEIPLPAVGTIVLFGKGLKTQTMAIDGSTGSFSLPVIGTGAVKKALRRRGKRKVSINVTYTPSGSSATTASRKVMLIKKKHKKRRRHKK